MADNTKRCPNCGAELSEVNGKPAQFCMNCGTKVDVNDANPQTEAKTEKATSYVDKVKQLERDAKNTKSNKTSKKKDPKDKKKTIILICGLIALLILITSIQRCSGKSTTSTNVDPSAKYNLYIDVQYKENLLLNKYDVDVYLDNEEIGTVKQGETFTHLASVQQGEHEVRFSKTDDDSVDGSKTFDVNNDTTLSCVISSSGSSISISDVEFLDSIAGSQMEVPEIRGMNLKEALDNLKKAGYSNIVSEPQEDAMIFDENNWIVVAQNKTPGTSIDKNDKFIVSSVQKDNFTSAFSRDEKTGNYYKMIDFYCGGVAFEYPSYYAVTDTTIDVARNVYPKENDFYASLLFDDNPYNKMIGETNDIAKSLEDSIHKILKLDDNTKTIVSTETITVAGLPACRINTSTGDEVTGESYMSAVLIANKDKNSILEVILSYDKADESNILYEEDFTKMLEKAQLDNSYKGFDESNTVDSVEKENQVSEDGDNMTSDSENETVFYSTNSRDVAKLGKSGKFAYCDSSGSYRVYYVIDMDEGYVYTFTDGNGNEICDRVKIDQGNLNDFVVITYHDGGDVWKYGLHFKWKNQPDILIVQDESGWEAKYAPTNLGDALKIMDTKKIHNY